MWLPYVVFREMYLMGIADYVSIRPMQKNWADCHVTDGSVFTNIAGC